MLSESFHRYEPNESFYYELVSILRRGLCGAIDAATLPPQLQVLAVQRILVLQPIYGYCIYTRAPLRTDTRPQVQLVLIFQLVIQFRLAPFIEAKLDVVETLLTIVLCVLSFCGMAFSLGGPSLPLLAAGSEGPLGESPGTAYVMAIVFAWLNLGLGLGLTWFGILSEARIVFSCTCTCGMVGVYRRTYIYLYRSDTFVPRSLSSCGRTAGISRPHWARPSAAAVAVASTLPCVAVEIGKL